MFRTSLFALLVSAILALTVLAVDQPVVKTNLGLVRGNAAESRDGRKYYQFLGIPYGKAERFQPPTKADAWGDDIRDATEFGSVCPHVDLKLKNNENPKFIGKEDCLNVNVYTPKLPGNGEHKVLLPVLVWFTSSGFISGSGNYVGAKYFMDTDVILVTLNYRLGPFGYLNIGDDSAAGNQGLKDQVEALKWVQENIEQFGGDKGRVTIFGHGSGGADVQYHLLSSLSKGLFHNAISQTGGSFAPWAFATDPIHQAKQFAERAGCPVDTKENLITCLKGKKIEEFDVHDYWWLGSTDKERITWRPSVEANPSKAFLTHNPFVLIAEGKVENKVPLIIGVNELDGAIPILQKVLDKPEVLAKINKDFDAYVPTFLGYKKTATDPAAVTKKIKDLYFEGKDLSENNKFRITHVTADRFFFWPALDFAIKYSSIAPTYTYVNTYAGQFSHFNLNGVKNNGSAYYDELQYEFPLKHYDVPEIAKESPDYEFSKNLVNLWSSFAENGKPTKTWGTEKVWEKFDPSKQPISTYGLNPETKKYVIPEDNLKRHALWGDMYGNLLKSEHEDPPKEAF